MDNELVEAVALEPCPFCGSKLRPYETHRSSETFHAHVDNDCALTGFILPPEDVKAWNIRTPLASLKAENEALREALIEGRIAAAADVEEASDADARGHAFLSVFKERLAKIDDALTKQGG